jgi:hypothetical protein
MDYQAKQAAKAVAAAAMQAASPFLIPATGNDLLTTAAKNLRIQLKRAFPGVKFQVKTERYSGGNSMNVRWIDGPTADQVEFIADKYSAGKFDGMTDCYNYEACAFTDAFGEAMYVFCSRENSDVAITNAMRTVSAQFAGNLAERSLVLNLQDYRAGVYMNTAVMTGAGADPYWSLGNIIRRMAAKRTYALDKSPKALPMVEADEVAA